MRKVCLIYTVYLGYFEIPWQQRAFHNILWGLENWGYLLPSCGWCLLCQTTPKAPRSVVCPPPILEVKWYSEGSSTLYREVCVCVNSFCNACNSKPIQKLFLPSFVTSSLPLLCADKKMVVAAIVYRNSHCFLALFLLGLKIISSGAIRNVTGQQRINSG